MLVAVLPVPVTYGLAWLGAEIAFRLATGARAAATANLRRVLGPEATRRDLARAVQGAFRTQAYNYVDMFLMPRVSLDALLQRVDIVNGERYRGAHALGKGMVLTTAHHGNFDLLVQVSLAMGIPVTVLMERISPDPLFRFVAGLRGSHGMRLLPVGPKAVRELLRALHRGEVAAVVADRDPQGRGVEVTYFGEKARLPAGPVELAMRTGAPLVPTFGLRLPGRRYRIIVEPPLELETEGPEHELVARNVQKLAAVLERHIRAYPEQLVMFSPIWPDSAATGEGAAASAARAVGIGR